MVVPLIKKAKQPQDIALAFGFMCHAAGDMFAHTYVNMYAGDAFSLSDDERDVELRHFTLEKYIERATPHPITNEQHLIDWKNDIAVSEGFLAEYLILNEDVYKQYLKSGSGVHLSAMFGVKTAVNDLNSETAKLIKQVTAWSAKYYKEQAKIMIDVATGKQLLVAAELDLIRQKATLLLEETGYNVGLKAMEEAKNIITKNPQLITFNEQLLVTQTKKVADALAESARITGEVNQAVADMQNQISGWESRLSGLVCEVVGWIPYVGDELSPACGEIDELRSRIRGAQNAINGHRQRAAIANRIAEETSRLCIQTNHFLDKLKDEYEKAVKGMAEGVYQAAIAAAETKLRLQKELIAQQEKYLQKLKIEQEKLQEKLNIVDDIIDKVKALVDKYNVITLLIENWSRGITKAAEEFILAGHGSGTKLLIGDGNPMDDYCRWYGCYGGVFTGVPSQIGDGVCFVKDHLAEIKNKYNDLMNSLPTIVQWALNPTKKATDLAFEKLKPTLQHASVALVGFITDKKTSEFLEILVGWEYASREKLDKVYSEDHSHKRLLLFPAVSQLIDKDMGLTGGMLNVQSFHPLAHSVTMAKLALLEPGALNQVINDLAGEYVSPYFGATIYQSQDEHFSLLLGVLRNIDGNHQWQAYALPYPRRSPNNVTPLYAYDYYQDHSKGLKIWVDPYLREKVFKGLFNGSVLGSLGQRPELQWSTYKFPECAAYLYPTTQDAKGKSKTSDVICNDLWNPNVEKSWSSNNKNDFRIRYHQCDTIIWGDKHWTIVGSYFRRSDADEFRNEIEKTFPDLYANIAEQQGGQKFWTVMLATCTDSARANEARNIAIRRNIASDAYVWKYSEVFRTKPRPAKIIIRGSTAVKTK